MAALIPAYRIKRRDGGLSLAFRCPHCRVVHSHGLPGGHTAPVQNRASHCHAERSPWRTCGYQLLVVGEVARLSCLPAATAADIERFGEALAG